MVALLALEWLLGDSFWPKTNCCTQNVHLAVTFSKIRIDKTHKNAANSLANSFQAVRFSPPRIACVASVSNGVIGRKLEQEQKKRCKGSSSFALVPTFSTNSRGNACDAGYSAKFRLCIGYRS